MGFLGKRGQQRRPLWTVVGLVLAVFIILLFINKATGSVVDADFTKHYLANDIALTLETMQSVSGNVLYGYVPKNYDKKTKYVKEGIHVSVTDIAFGAISGNIAGVMAKQVIRTFDYSYGNISVDLTKYIFNIAMGKVSVASADEKIKEYASQIFSYSSYYDMEKEFTNPALLTISKTGSDIQFKDSMQQFNAQNCINLETPGNYLSSVIYIDSDDNPFSKDILSNLLKVCRNCKSFSSKDVKLMKNEAQNANMIISINVGLQPGDLRANFAFDSAKSSKLGCLITNKLAVNNYLVSPVSLPVSLKRLSDKDRMRVLDDKIASVYLELADPTTIRMFTPADKSKIALQINDAIRQYYSSDADKPLIATQTSSRGEAYGRG